MLCCCAALGSYPETSQRGAHEAASHARKLLEDGIDPSRAERPSAKRRLTSVALLPVQHLAFGEVRGSQKAGFGQRVDERSEMIAAKLPFAACVG